MGLEKKDTFNFNGLELENTYHVIRKTSVQKEVRKSYIDVYASFDAFEAGHRPLTSMLVRDVVDDEDDEVINIAYTKLKMREEYSDVTDKKSDKEKSKNELKKEKT